jgi:hypothetical protein
MGGLLVEFPARSRIAFESGALVGERGTKMKVSHQFFGSANGDIRMIYLDVPAVALVEVANAPVSRVQLVLGSTVGIRLDARTRVTAQGQTQDQPITVGIPRLDVGLTVGGRVEPGHALFDVRYTHGLRNMAEGPDAQGENVKHRVVSMMAGWRF